MSTQLDATKTAGTVVADDLITTIKLFGVSGSAVEIRIPDAGRDGTVSGYFNLAKKAVKAATEMSGKVPALYITMNPCPSALLGRANNLLKARVKLTTADSDITGRRWMLIDIDPIRPSGISSTAAEHDAALALAETISTWLQTQGFPPCVLADSGNGAHVLVRIDMPNDVESKALVERCLLALAHHFNTDALKIDTKVFNAARITKFYGTMVCKGDVLPDRPHRLSRILSVPDLLDVCPREAIERLAGMAPSPASKSGYTTIAKEFGASFDIDGYIAQYADQLILRAPKPWQGGRLWVFDVCPFDQSHEQNGATQLIQHASGAVSVSCHHDRCTGKGWEDLKALFPPAKSRRKEPEATTGSSKKPTIITNMHEDWDDLLEQVFAELVRINAPDPEVFQRGVQLVRVRVDEDGRPLIEPMTEASLRGHLARTMLWKMRDELGFYKAVPPPVAVVKNLMSRKEWTGIPALRDIVQAPIFSKDGHIIATPGYHPEARLWYAPWSRMDISVPERPTEIDLKQARELILNELLGDFPFDGDASRAHAVTAILLPFVRELIQGPTPLHLFTAPTPGSGKGLLVEVTSLIATGRPALPVSPPRDDEEMRKRITAQLRRGTPIIVLDNLTKKLDSAALCAALTASEWQDRILGVSEMSSTLPNRALWAATGNNPELSLDVARRTIACRLDSGIERPWERKDFRHPELGAWASAHRGELVQAVLTLVQAWLRAGSPRSQHPPIGSFESWATVMAGVLEMAGIKGFLENYKDVYEAASAEIGEWLDFVEAWYEAHGGKPVLVKELCNLARQRELLSDVLGDGIDASQRTRLGNALSRHKGRVFNGYQIHQDPRSRHGTPYRLKVVAAPVDISEPAVTLEPDEAPF